MSETYNHNKNNPSPQNKSANEGEDILGYGIVGMIVFVGFVILIQYASLAARYVYAPFAIPVWLAGKAGGTTGSVKMILLFATALIAIWLVRFFVLNKKGFFWLSYAGLFFFIAAMEMATGFESSFLTRHVSLLCNPSTGGLGSILSCQNGANEVASIGTSNLIIWSFVPNIIIAWPLFYILISGFFRVSTEHPFARTRKIHDIDSLIKEQKVQFPHLLFFDLVNPIKLPNSDGQMRMMDGSRRFCFEHDLISNFTIRPDLADSSTFGKQFGETPVPPDLSYYDFKKQDLVPVLDAERFERLMNQQLGEPWAGVENLEPAETIVLAIALPRACSLDEAMSTEEANRIKQAGEKRMKEVWVWAAKDINSSESDYDEGLGSFPKLEEYREVIEAWLDHEITQKILTEHAYVRTVLYRVLEDAKKLGVMQPSSVRWLKYYNRAVWSVVQNVNRPSSFAENIASVAHYKEERREGVAINRPMFQSAYNGLVERVREFKYEEEAITGWHEWKTAGDPTGLAKLSLMSLETAYSHGMEPFEERKER